MTNNAETLTNWFESEYSPSSAIGGNYQPFIERYCRESDSAYSLVGCQRDLPYGTHEREKIDFFPAPDLTKPAKLVVFIHGGYWQELSKSQSSFNAPSWHNAGIAHAVIGYTLAPEASIEQIVTQCIAAVEWLRNQATRLNIDSNKIVITGSSAGAYLAAACARHFSQSGEQSLKGMVLLSGIYELEPLIRTTINHALKLTEESADRLNLMIGQDSYCPAVICWGEIETSEFKRQSLAFAERLQLKRNREPLDVNFFEIPGRNHFDLVHDFSDPSSKLFRSTMALLD